MEDAWIKINQVEEEKPQWEMIQIAKAIIGYYSALSPSAFPSQPLSWAKPVLWQFVKRDNESTLRLKNAENTFSKILTNNSNQQEQKLIFQSFRLACLANDAERQEEASNYFQELLAEDVTHPFALGWEQVRDFDVNYNLIRNAIESKLKNNFTSQEHIEVHETIILVDIYLKNGNTQKARQLLKTAKPKFHSIGGESVFSFWFSRLAIIENKFNEALRIARKVKNRLAGRLIQIMILREQYLRQRSNKKAFKKLISYLEKYYNKTANPAYLIELCYLNAEKRNWSFIAENYEDFVKSVDTADSVRIAAFALNQTNQPTKCLQLLENYESKFPNSTLTSELIRLRVSCYIQQGTYSKAVSEAELLQAKDDSIENLLLLIDAKLQKGDVVGLAYNAHKILQKKNVEPKYYLRVAKLVALEDVDLAKKMATQ